MLYLVRICGYCVRRSPIKPVSCMTSRMSVKFDPGNEFHRLEPSAHLTFLLAGNCAAACARNPARPIKASRLFITELLPKQCLPHHPPYQIQMEALPSPLSSRPKRSEVEGSAVPRTPPGDVFRQSLGPAVPPTLKHIPKVLVID